MVPDRFLSRKPASNKDFCWHRFWCHFGATRLLLFFSIISIEIFFKVVPFSKKWCQSGATENTRQNAYHHWIYLLFISLGDTT